LYGKGEIQRSGEEASFYSAQLLSTNQPIHAPRWVREANAMRLQDCHNFHDFRRMAKRRLPGPIFNYIDGAADDEVTDRRNTCVFEDSDLVPSVLQGVREVDLSTTVLGQKLALPFYCSSTALQQLFHHDGERAVAAAAAKYGTMFGVSSLGTTSLEEARRRCQVDS